MIRESRSGSSFFYVMSLGRPFELAAAESYAKGKHAGILDLFYPGKEAAAVGSLRGADPGDYVYPLIANMIMP